jgi:hypothetical protein
VVESPLKVRIQLAGFEEHSGIPLRMRRVQAVPRDQITKFADLLVHDVVLPLAWDADHVEGTVVTEDEILYGVYLPSETAPVARQIAKNLQSIF